MNVEIALSIAACCETVTSNVFPGSPLAPVAVMVAVPFATAVTTPLETPTIATPVAPLANPAPATALPFASFAESVSVAPVARSLAGVIEELTMPTNCATVMPAVTPASLAVFAVTVDAPLPTAVATSWAPVHVEVQAARVTTAPALFSVQVMVLACTAFPRASSAVMRTVAPIAWTVPGSSALIEWIACATVTPIDAPAPVAPLVLLAATVDAPFTCAVATPLAESTVTEVPAVTDHVTGTPTATPFASRGVNATMSPMLARVGLAVGAVTAETC